MSEAQRSEAIEDNVVRDRVVWRTEDQWTFDVRNRTAEEDERKDKY